MKGKDPYKKVTCGRCDCPDFELHMTHKYFDLRCKICGLTSKPFPIDDMWEETSS